MVLARTTLKLGARDGANGLLVGNLEGVSVDGGLVSSLFVGLGDGEIDGRQEEGFVEGFTDGMKLEGFVVGELLGAFDSLVFDEG